MSPISTPALPPGSKIFVTGVNGFIGSHIADQLLAEGYRVTGTTRDLTKVAWLQGLLSGNMAMGNLKPSRFLTSAAMELTMDLSTVREPRLSASENYVLTRAHQGYPELSTLPQTCHLTQIPAKSFLAWSLSRSTC